MNSIVIALVAFGCTFGAAIAGVLLRDRLPAHHLDGDSKDAVKLVMGLIATITALVLGLLISSAHSAFDAQDAEVQQLGVHVYEIDRSLAHFGPDAAPQREQLHRILAADIGRIWPGQGVGTPTDSPLAAQKDAAGLFQGIASLSPKTDIQKFGQDRALQLLASAGETRLLLAEQARGSLSWPFLFVLIAWLTLLFLGFGLFARMNATVVAAFFVGALSVAGALLLILEMNHPYSGWMQVSSAPLRDALALMNR
jgi:hypothetical protein